MPALTWHNVLPTVLLKLIARSPDNNVVSGQPTEDSSQRSSRLESLWAGAAAEPSQDDSYTAFVGDSLDASTSSHQSTVQATQHSPFSEAGTQASLQQHVPQIEGKLDSPLPIAKPVLDGLLPGGRHRRTASASSDASLVSANTASTNPGAYTGLTQSGHYDLTQDVILRGEFITASQSKAVIVAIRFASYIGTTILIVALSYKIKEPDQWFTHNSAVEIWNVVLGVLCFAALATCCSILAQRVYHGHRQRKHWSRRRRVTVALNGAELIVQLINVCSWVAPNAFLLHQKCSWFHPFVVWCAFLSWTCWNTIFLIMLIEAHNCAPWSKGRTGKRRRDAIVMDAPIWYHTPKLILWCIFEALDLFLVIWVTHDQVGPVRRAAIRADPDCAIHVQDCNLKTLTLVMEIIIAALLVFYLLLWFWYMWRAHRDLQKHQYMLFKMGNLNIRMQAHRRLVAAGLFLISFIALVFVKINSCSSYIESWLGFTPVQVVETAVAVGGAYFFMPKNPDLKDPVLRVWLQEFAWTEDEKASKLAQRGCVAGSISTSLQNEPMFCFGTAVKLFYWSHLVYDIKESGSRRFSIETALGLFGLDKYELMWEKAHDTKVLLAWGNNTVLVSFRGSASLTNALADVQVWMSRYPDSTSKSGGGPDLLAAPATAFSWLPGGRPAVHRGFLNSWRANSLNQRIKQRIWEILYGEDMDRNNVKVLCTGHSLGGALANLAAFDIQRHCPCLKPTDVSCYTFGAPRVGNHAWAKMYDATVPDTWVLINNQDMLARAGRFWGLYKRAGHRVLVNANGDLIVRPTFIEAAAQLMRPWGGGILGGSVPDHLLVNYRKSLVAICLAQFNNRKGFAGGNQGVLQLLESAEVRDVLATGGVQFEQIRRMGPFGGVALQLQGLVQKGFNKVMEPNSDATIICTDGVCRLVHERDLTASKRALHRPSAFRQIMNGQRSVSTHLDLADLDLNFPDHPSNCNHGIDIELGQMCSEQGPDGQQHRRAEVILQRHTSDLKQPDLSKTSQASGPSSFGEPPESLWDYLQRMKTKGRLGELAGLELPPTSAHQDTERAT